MGELRDFRRATTSSFNALREEMNERFAQVEERFSRVDERFAHVDEHFAHIEERFGRVDDGFIEMRGKLNGAAAGQQRIVELLEGLIADQQ